MRRVFTEHRRLLLWGCGAIALLVVAVALLNALGGSHGFSLSAASGEWPYLTVFAFVFGDAICPILPGETTLNAAATLAADGSLDLGVVMVAGALGAIAGDSALYGSRDSAAAPSSRSSRRPNRTRTSRSRSSTWARARRC